jgi:sulfonate transport system permease protein
MKRLGRGALELILPVTLVLLWWATSRNSTSLYFPPLSDIWSRFVQTWLFKDIGPDVVPTLRSIFLGYLLAVIFGIALGLVLGSMPRLHHFFSPLLELFRALPGVALVPVFIVVIGIGLRMEITLVVFGAIWPILLNTIDGVAGIDPTIHDTALSYRLTPIERLRHVILPAASPQIVAGMKVGLSGAVVIVIVTEMVASVEGIGYFILQSQADFDLTGMWSAVILMGIIGYLLNKLFGVFERYSLAWHRGLHQRKEIQ